MITHSANNVARAPEAAKHVKKELKSLTQSQLVSALISDRALALLEPELTRARSHRSDAEWAAAQRRSHELAAHLHSSAGVPWIRNGLVYRGMRLTVTDFMTVLRSELTLTRRHCYMLTFSRDLWPSFAYAIKPMWTSLNPDTPAISAVFQMDSRRIKRDGFCVSDDGPSCVDVMDVRESIPSKYVERCFVYLPSSRKFVPFVHAFSDDHL